MKFPKKLFYSVLGHFFLLMGFLGIFLPLVPTTVFLLGAGWMYARSNEKFHQWLFGNRIFGPYLKNYTEKRGIPHKVKVTTLLVLWLTLGWGQSFLPPESWIRSLLGIIGISVSVHVAVLKETKNE